jgi:nicotinate-nucleotide adenylyltransferase
MTGWVTPPGPVADGLRIGLLGGSFNPAHAGHLYISETAIRRLGLDYVWWLVSPGNPLKPQAGMAPLCARLARARTIAARHPRLKVSDLERDIGTVYTVETLRFLKRRFATVRFVWLMGSDNLEQFSRWRAWEDIATLVPIVVVLRPTSVLAPLKAKAMQRFAYARTPSIRAPVSITVIDGRRNETSATRIRNLGGRDGGMLGSIRATTDGGAS